MQRTGPVITAADPSHSTHTVSTVTMGVSSDYFRGLGLSMLRGRSFTEAEWRSPSGSPVGIIDQTLATHLFGTEDPIGHFVQINPTDNDPAEVLEVVGIAPALKHQMEDDEAGPHLYRPYAQNFRAGVYLHVTTTLANDEAALLPALRSLLRAVDAQLPVVTLETGPMFRERNPMLWIVRTGARCWRSLAPSPCSWRRWASTASRRIWCRGERASSGSAWRWAPHRATWSHS